MKVQRGEKYMQSYKLRKTSETVLFPIEHELRLLRQESDRSFTVLMLKIVSVVFSGIGTTVLSQKEYIPSLIEYIACRVFKRCISSGWMILWEILVAMGLFFIVSIVAIIIINWLNSIKDNKKNDFERENLAEVFHKIILNNIITGKSFTKKAQVKYSEMEHCFKNRNNEENLNNKEMDKQFKEAKRELALYLSEAFYYFMIAERQIDDRKIIEVGKRDKYIEFLNEVGVLALMESLLMYEKSVNELKKLFEYLQNLCPEESDDNEIFLVQNGIQRIDEIKDSVLEWKTNLSNTVKMMDEEMNNI